MARWTIRGYANQVRLFLFLLVLFLVMQGVLNFSLLFSARDALGGAVATGASEIASRVAASLPVDEESGAPADVPPALAASLARRHRLREAAILRPDGTTMASSLGPRGGTDDDFATIPDSARRGLASGREHVDLRIPGGGESELLVFRPLLDTHGRLQGVLKVSVLPGELVRLDRRIRAFAVLQAIGVAAVLALTFAFIRWLLRPYRLLLRTAGAMLPASTDEDLAIQRPDDLVSSFQAVVDRLRRHEREIEALDGGSGGESLAGPVIAGMPSGLIAVDSGGRVTALNPAGGRILGTEASTAVGRAFRQVMAGAPELQLLVEECLAGGGPRSRVLLRAGEGGASHLGASVSPTGGPGGGPPGAVCLFSDLTEIRAVEEKVRARESLAEVGQISAGIAHELRNSLATILGYARLANRASSGEARDHTEAIRTEVESARAILDDYLRFARPFSLQIERFPLAAAVTEVVESLREDPAAAGRTLEVAGSWAEIEADEGLLRQALTNLLRNGLEATAEGGRVRIRGGTLADGQVRIEVEDDGPGPPADAAPEDLFRPFFSTKREGTGLGLALVRKTVLYHDGRITVDRGDLGGARFVLVLPARAREEPPGPRNAAS